VCEYVSGFSLKRVFLLIIKNEKMKKITFLAILLIAATQFSFIKAPVPVKQLTQTLQSAAVPIVYTATEKIDFPFLVDIPCAGETVQLQGTLLVLDHITINGSRVTIKSSYQPQGLSGTGSVSGNTYHATGQTQYTSSGPLVNGQYSYTFVNNFRIIGQNTGNNYIVHETFHVTVNADGTIISTVDNFIADCK
jgi:hypothetical protein